MVQGSYYANADFTRDPLIAGFEWNVRPEVEYIDCTVSCTVSCTVLYRWGR